MSQADLAGPPDPDPPPASGSGEAVRHVGGPWFEVDGPDGPERVRGREAAEALASGAREELQLAEYELQQQEATAEDHVLSGSTVSERFRGPCLALDLSSVPDPTTVHVQRHDGHSPPVAVSGSKVTRNAGHFGRGRWTVTYRPA